MRALKIMIFIIFDRHLLLTSSDLERVRLENSEYCTAKGRDFRLILSALTKIYEWLPLSM